MVRGVSKSSFGPKSPTLNSEEHIYIVCSNLSLGFPGIGIGRTKRSISRFLPSIPFSLSKWVDSCAPFSLSVGIIFVEIRVKLLGAFGTNTVAKLSFRALAYVLFHLPPIALVVTYLLARGTDRQKAA